MTALLTVIPSKSSYRQIKSIILKNNWNFLKGILHLCV